MNTQANTIIRKHVEAVIQLMLGNRRIKPGLAIFAGEQLDMAAQVELARLAATAQTDTIYLEFSDIDTPEPKLAGIATIAPRDVGCHIQTGCQLYLSKTGSRAMLLPKETVRGLFRASPGELIHVDRKPVDAPAGIKRASNALRRLVERGIDVTGRAEIAIIPEAA